MKLSELKINPNNPRILKDDKFKRLVKSIQEFPKMLKLRPIIVDNDNIVIGGNMRLKALQELKYKEIPDEWVKKASELTDEEKKRFIISDNVGFGEWDYDILANEWDIDELNEWGLEFDYGKNILEKQTHQTSSFERSHVLISYHPNKHIIIQQLLEQLANEDNIEIENGSN